MTNKADLYSRIIKTTAQEFGFQSCGISEANFLEKEAPILEHYLKQDFHGKMAYMANHFDKRLDPRLLVEGARSVISLSYNYFPRKVFQENDRFKISKYAYGEDYHVVIKDILREMLLKLEAEIGAFSFRMFVDSAPVLERAWAEKSGVGWIGKNSNLITKQHGSFFFLAEIICDLELSYDAPVTGHCGSCRKCIDACPTKAIVGDGVINGSRCISYATIELKEQIPNEFKGRMDDWIFGCDVCQDVCPWNRFSRVHQQDRFLPKRELEGLEKEDWRALSETLFSYLFSKSAVQRTRYAGLMRNISFLSEEEGLWVDPSS